jgi:acyl-[acyl carrier protein]--UDP-N-acetylglucosamine O-acyltransferase
MATFQKNVQINDSLNVTNDAHIGGNFQVDLNSDLDGTLDVQGATNMQSTLTVAGAADLNSTLDVDGDTQLDTTNIDGSLTVRDNADLNADLDVDGVSNLDTTDIDGSLNVQDMATFQKNVQINDSLNVTNDAHIGGNFQVDLNSDLDGTLNVALGTHLQDTLYVAGNSNLDGMLNVQLGTHLQDTLYVAGFANFDDSVDVEMSVNIQDNLDVNDSLAVNSAGNEGTVFTVYNSLGTPAVTIETYDSNTSSGGSSTTLTTPKLVVQEDAAYNGDMSVSGSLSVTGNILSAAAPTSDNHITNKQYVDDAIAAAITPPQIWDYDVINSTSGDTVFYINGDLLLYATEEEATINYTIRLYGENLGLSGDMAIDNVHLRARGNTRGMNNADNNLTVWTTAGNGATFNIGYTDIKDLAGGQEDGYVSTHLTFTTVGGDIYNTGVTIRFYLDSSNAAASGSTFSTNPSTTP